MTDNPPDLPGEDRSADERTTLLQALDFYRAVLVRKAWGCSDEQLQARLGESDLTLGGLLVHMAKVENHWFPRMLAGESPSEPWASAPWATDPDWDFHVAAEWGPAEVMGHFEAAVEQSRAAVDAAPSLDQDAAVRDWNGEPMSLRWILVHMISEYARHCGHADLIRESIDRSTGD